MRRPPPRLRVDPQVDRAVAAAAATAYPRETGGLLLGWWQDGTIVVRHAVEIPDPGATTNSWSRAQASAQSALDDALRELDHPWLGYVGDWHSQPSACPVSTRDVAAIRRASRHYSQPLVLLVHRVDGGLDHVIAHRGRVLTVAPRPPDSTRKPAR